ncbi:Transcriptional regulator, ArsR family [hydrothermal vent metagenome]|uniref:Transcriptional regulator, ArsR family n=1 Tax=hydrothermal vent metagenome TaxID=652676 RepID=A0A3B0TZ75_9ZZZZ
MLDMPNDIRSLQNKALEVATLLKAIGNEKRLIILCQLADREEVSVGALAQTVGLGQSALSQHLAKMRDEGIVTTRREGQTIWYRIADGRVKELMAILYQLYCAD